MWTPFEQLHTKHLLKSSDLPAYRALDQGQIVGCLAEAQVSRNRFKGDQRAD